MAYPHFTNKVWSLRFCFCWLDLVFSFSAHRTMEKNKKKGKIFWRETRLLAPNLFPLILSEVHIVTWSSEHTTEHNTWHNNSLWKPFTHTHIYMYTHTQNSSHARLSAGFYCISLNLSVSMGNACVCEILFSYISWQGEVWVPLSFQCGVNTWQGPCIAIVHK